MADTPKVEFITYCAFWLSGSGYTARTREMLRFLSQQADLRVVFLGPLSEEDRIGIDRLDFPVTVVDLDLPKESTYDGRAAAYAGLAAKTAPELYIVDKTENSYILDRLPAGPEKWVDTHDLISERTRKLQGHQVAEQFPLNEAEEKAILAKYDLVICIQPREYKKVVEWLGEERAVCVPHPVSVPADISRSSYTRIGFVASGWHANAYGLQAFLRFVWERAYRAGASLHVYGTIANTLMDVSLPNVYFHGFVENLDDCYRNIDIAINPVLYGAGLKIKSIEAMANGLPLVTTPEGATGLEELDGEALLIASSWDNFAKILEELIIDPDRCALIGKRGAEFAQQNLTRQACFAPLAARLQACRY